MRRLWTVGLLLSGLSGLGCKEEGLVDKPTAPNMDELVGLYEHPDGVFDDETADQILTGAAEVWTAIVSLGIQDQVSELLGAAQSSSGGEGEGEGEGSAIDLPIEGEGFLRVTRICNGWEEEPVPDESNGDIQLTVGFTDSGIDPVIWGGVSACRYRLTDQPILIADAGEADDWDIRLYMGNSVDISGLFDVPWILDLDLSAQLGDETISVGFDFQFTPSTGDIVLRAEAGGGSVLVNVTTLVWRIRAANGEFDCDIEAATCDPAGSL